MSRQVQQAVASGSHPRSWRGIGLGEAFAEREVHDCSVNLLELDGCSSRQCRTEVFAPVLCADCLPVDCKDAVAGFHGLLECRAVWNDVDHDWFLPVQSPAGAVGTGFALGFFTGQQEAVIVTESL